MDNSALAREGKSSLVFSSSCAWNWEADESCMEICNNSKVGDQDAHFLILHFNF